MKQRKRYPLMLFTIAVTLCLIGCKKAQKTEIQKEPQATSETENKVQEIEAQYESTSEDFNEGETISQPLENIEVITTSDENDQATKELRKYVNLHRDLVKKYKATGNADYKEQALLIEEKAKKVQEKLSQSQYTANSTQIRSNGDLFLEMEATIQDLRN